jgi:hypothetical protein
MKTILKPAFKIFFLSSAFFISATLALAESDREFESAMLQRQRDFNSYIKERNSEKRDLTHAAEVLHAARKAQEREHAENELAYQNVMKRYSMEEIEARDREDDERLLRERAQAEATRSLFIESRDRRRSIEASIGPLDPYQEFEINMTVEPETKVSHPVSSGGSSIGGAGDGP